MTVMYLIKDDYIIDESTNKRYRIVQRTQTIEHVEAYLDCYKIMMGSDYIKNELIIAYEEVYDLYCVGIDEYKYVKLYHIFHSLRNLTKCAGRIIMNLGIFQMTFGRHRDN